MKKTWHVYIMASRQKGALYVGMTSDLFQRIWQHRESLNQEAFTTQYQIKQLVYFEEHNSFEDAALKETQLKRWKRAWKIQLIEKKNPSWNDLYTDDFLNEF